MTGSGKTHEWALFLKAQLWGECLFAFLRIGLDLLSSKGLKCAVNQSY
jgi:hypothetical protein